MTTLSADKVRDYALGNENHLPVVASDIIYAGAAVSVNSSGYARPLNTSDTVFAGFALSQCDNSAGSAGDKNVRVRNSGTIILPVTGLTIDDVGKPVYASDDDAFTMTASTNLHIGSVRRYISDGLGEVEFWVPRAPSTVGTSDISNGAVTTAKLGADAVDGTKIADDAVSLEHLDAAITPSHIPVYAGEITWSGGLATLAETVTGVAATDIVVCSILTKPTEAAYLVAAAAATNAINLELSAANTSNDAVISYVVYRAAA